MPTCRSVPTGSAPKISSTNSGNAALSASWYGPIDGELSITNSRSTATQPVAASVGSPPKSG